MSQPVSYLIRVLFTDPATGELGVMIFEPLELCGDIWQVKVFNAERKVRRIYGMTSNPVGWRDTRTVDAYNRLSVDPYRRVMA